MLLHIFVLDHYFISLYIKSHYKSYDNQLNDNLMIINLFLCNY